MTNKRDFTKLIYLACPYSVNNADKKLLSRRFKEVTKIAGALINEGFVVFSPITHNHPLQQWTNMPDTWDFWKDFDETFLLRCDKLIVYMGDQWESSIGIAAEIRFAIENNIPVEYLRKE